MASLAEMVGQALLDKALAGDVEAGRVIPEVISRFKRAERAIEQAERELSGLEGPEYVEKVNEILRKKGIHLNFAVVQNGEVSGFPDSPTVAKTR
jgi:hypothetical protein